jgi:hypothetical protein
MAQIGKDVLYLLEAFNLPLASPCMVCDGEIIVSVSMARL